MWYAGIDWADRHHDAVVIDAAGQRVAALRVAHDAAGLAQLTDFLRGLGDIAERPEHLACIVETSRGLLIAALLDAGLPVYPVNPKTVDQRRKPSGAKTDAIDAYLLARTGRSDLPDLRRLVPDGPLVAELRLLTRDLEGLIQGQTRLLNQLTACLKAYYPAALALFSKLHQPATLAFLRACPTLEQARATTVEELTALLKAARHPHPGTKAQWMHAQLCAPQLEGEPAVARAKARLLLALVAQLAPLLEAIADYDKAIGRLFTAHADSGIFAGLPGTGTRLAPRLLAEWGDDRARYAAAAAMQALAGTAPVTFQSGTYAKVHRRGACNATLRNAVFRFAWLSTQQEDWAADYYRRKRREGKGHSVAVRALANHWVRIIYALWAKREAYDPAVFLAARQAHAPRAA